MNLPNQLRKVKPDHVDLPSDAIHIETLEGWLRDTLPTERSSSCYLHSKSDKPDGDPFSSPPAPTVIALAAQTKQEVAAGWNSWLSIGLYDRAKVYESDSTGRNNENIIALQALKLEIDIGDGGHSSVEGAITSLNAILEALDWPRPEIITSSARFRPSTKE